MSSPAPVSSHPVSSGRGGSAHGASRSRGWFARGRFGAPSWSDLRQGAFLDCWLLSALASLLFVGATPDHGAADDGAYRFRFFTHAGPTVVTVDGRLKYVAGISLFATSRAGDTWAGLWEKAYLYAICGASGDTPDLSALEEPGIPGDALAAFTGRPVATLAGGRGVVDALEARCDPSGRLAVAAVGATSHAVDHRQTALGSSHAYSVLGVTHHAGRRHVLVNDPRGRRDLGRPLAWGVLDETRWLTRETVAARGEHSGVMPLDESFFAESFRYIDWVEAAAPREPELPE